MKNLSQSRFSTSNAYTHHQVTDRAGAPSSSANSIEGRIFSDPWLSAYAGRVLHADFTGCSHGFDHTMCDYYLQQLKAHEPDGAHTHRCYSAGVFPAIELALRCRQFGEVRN